MVNKNYYYRAPKSRPECWPTVCHT